MGRKRKSATKGRTRKSNKKTLTNDFVGGILVVFGLILFVFLKFENIGVIAEFFKSLSMGLFGYMAYLLPVTLVVVGVRAIYVDEKTKLSSDLLKGVYLTAVISATVASFTNNSSGIFDNFVKYVIEKYNGGIDGTCVAGVVGSIFSSILVNFIGAIATRILLVFASLISVLCVFKISFKQLFYGIYNVYAYIYNAIVSVINILFGADEEEQEDQEDQEEEQAEKKLSKRQIAKQEKEQKKLALRMKEKGNPNNVDENLTLDRTEQVEFDFNKLGGKPSEKETQAKQQRDEFFFKSKKSKKKTNL